MPLKKVLRQLGVGETITGGEVLLEWFLMEATGSSSEEGLSPQGFSGATEMVCPSSVFKVPKAETVEAVEELPGSERLLRLRRKFPLSNIFSQLGSKVQ